ncbi:GFA family protein [Breoghania sp.]|uniref:GFA family protein n=1 Tax=Breoghania sp. TaxID=2065378 RepID=UPI00260EE4CB|nr:GFA family protein [Breoghania sp.]MDJ0932142.1 GFA family protein [Breoghania sp.]
MAMSENSRRTGGCQCGAVWFAVAGPLGQASICHCRMCQKALGNFFAPFVSVADDQLTWTRGQPRHFQSSNDMRRGFCENCGTPLTYEVSEGVAIAIGTFDDPKTIVPTIQFGMESKLPYVDRLHCLPGMTTEEDPDIANIIDNLVSYQHPDHDTRDWPPATEGWGQAAKETK